MRQVRERKAAQAEKQEQQMVPCMQQVPRMQNHLSPAAKRQGLCNGKKMRNLWKARNKGCRQQVPLRNVHRPHVPLKKRLEEKSRRKAETQRGKRKRGKQRNGNETEKKQPKRKRS